MRWFTSDPHYWHANVIKYCARPYSSVEAMNEHLILKWNSVVGPEDDVYVLGDFSLAFRAVESFTKRLMGRKHLRAGNHDWCHPAHKKARTVEQRKKWTQKYLDNGWESVLIEDTLDFPGHFKARLYHMPYAEEKRGDEPEQNHPKWRLEDDGLLLLCGHVHDKWKHRFTKKGTLMVNAGVDVWNMGPVSETEIVAFAEARLRERAA